MGRDVSDLLRRDCDDGKYDGNSPGDEVIYHHIMFEIENTRPSHLKMHIRNSKSSPQHLPLTSFSARVYHSMSRKHKQKSCTCQQTDWWSGDGGTLNST